MEIIYLKKKHFILEIYNYTPEFCKKLLIYHYYKIKKLKFADKDILTDQNISNILRHNDIRPPILRKQK